jgi:hypothetical protein
MHAKRVPVHRKFSVKCLTLNGFFSLTIKKSEEKRVSGFNPKNYLKVSKETELEAEPHKGKWEF